MKYFGEFEKLEDVRNEFHVSLTDLFPTERQMVFAWYGVGGYDGSALVVFKIKGQYYQVEGSHCSCYGLENQWEPDPVSKEQLKKYRPDFTSGYNSDPEATSAWLKLFPSASGK